MNIHELLKLVKFKELESVLKTFNYEAFHPTLIEDCKDIFNELKKLKPDNSLNLKLVTQEYKDLNYTPMVLISIGVDSWADDSFIVMTIEPDSYKLLLSADVGMSTEDSKKSNISLASWILFDLVVDFKQYISTIIQSNVMMSWNQSIKQVEDQMIEDDKKFISFENTKPEFNEKIEIKNNDNGFVVSDVIYTKQGYLIDSHATTYDIEKYNWKYDEME